MLGATLNLQALQVVAGWWRLAAGWQGLAAGCWLAAARGCSACSAGCRPALSYSAGWSSGLRLRWQGLESRRCLGCALTSAPNPLPPTPAGGLPQRPLVPDLQLRQGAAGQPHACPTIQPAPRRSHAATSTPHHHSRSLATLPNPAQPANPGPPLARSPPPSRPGPASRRTGPRPRTSWSSWPRPTARRSWASSRAPTPCPAAAASCRPCAPAAPVSKRLLARLALERAWSRGLVLFCEGLWRVYQQPGAAQRVVSGKGCRASLATQICKPR